jgi:uncharacterized protein YjdB
MIMNRLSLKLTNSIRLIGLLSVLTLVMFSFTGCKKTIAVTSIKLDKTSLTLTEGESANLTATVSPSDATVGTYSWSSSDPSVASVNSGVVKALKAGSATIIVTTTDGGKSASCSVTVKSAKISVTGVTLDQTSLELVEGKTATLKATVAPSNATDPSVSWSSSDKGVATVDSNGGIIAVKAGSAILTVTTTDGGKTANCAVTVKPAKISVTGVTLDKTSASLLVGQTQQLKATVSPDNATDKSVSWSSSNANIASVDNAGLVTAQKPGSATITVVTTDGSKMATCDFTITQPVSGVSLDKTSLTLTEGDQATLTATIKPDDASNKEISWSSDSPSIATVENGKVTALKEGSAKITVTTKDGNKTAECAVTVNKKIIHVTGVSLDKTAASLVVGQTQQLTATVQPDNATDKSVYWISSNPNVATVDQTGNVTTVGPGSATITVVTTDGSKMATCDFTITQPVSGVTLDKSTLTLTEGDNATLTATVSPEDASNKEVSWSTSDAGIVSLDQTGNVLTVKATAVKEGTAKITVTTKDGGKTAECAVTVSKKIINVTGVTLDKNSASLLVGQTQQLTATVTPDNATDKSVTWSSSNPNVATVDQTGLVTAKAGGSVTITVITTDGSKMATCDVTVNQPVKSVALDMDNATVIIGETLQLTATISPADATNKALTWSSSDESVASVDKDGMVSALKQGEAVITAKSVEGPSASCTVTSIYVSIEDNYGIHPEASYEATTEVKMKIVDNATRKPVSFPTLWSSSDESVAKLNTSSNDGSEVIVSCLAPGSATITATIGNTVLKETLTVGIHFPDATFKKFLFDSGFDSDADGVISLKEGEAVTVLSMDNMGIKSVEGIQYFPYLHALIAGRNDLSSLDVSHNLELTTLYAFSNPSLHTVDVSMLTKMQDLQIDGINTIVLTAMPDLYHLECSDSYLTSLDLSKNPGLSILRCYNNRLSQLDLTNNQKLTTAEVGNQKNSSGSGQYITVKLGSSLTDKIFPNLNTNSQSFNWMVKFDAPATAIQVSPVTMTTNIGESFIVTATLTPSYSSSAITWSSSNTAVATVGQNGKVTAVSEGTAMIVAKTDNGLNAACRVTVASLTVPATSISISPMTITGIEGQTCSVTATILPSNTTQTGITWLSSYPSINETNEQGSNPGVFKFNKLSDGYYYTHGFITAQVTANKNIEVSNECNIYKMRFCLEKSHSQEVGNGTTLTINTETSTYLMFPLSSTASLGSNPTIATINILPINKIQVTSSNSSVAEGSVSYDATYPYVMIKAIAEGSATVTVTIGEVSRTIPVNVVKTVVPATSISLAANKTAVIEGQTVKFTATLLPSNTTETVRWQSWGNLTKVSGIFDNPGVFTASKISTSANSVTGSVNAIAGANTSVSANATTTIYRLRFFDSAGTDEYTESDALDVKNGSYKHLLIWAGGSSFATTSLITTDEISITSGNSSVATSFVGTDGSSIVIVVNGHQLGSTTITVKIGSVSRSFAVKVIDPVTSVTIAPSSITMIEGQSKTVAASFSPSGTGSNLSWSVQSNSGYLTLSPSGTNNANCTITSNYALADALGNSLTLGVYGTLVNNTSIVGTTSVTLLKMRFCTKTTGGAAEFTSLSYSKGASEFIYLSGTSASKIGYDYASSDLISKSEVSVSSSNASVVTAEMVDAYPVHFYLECVAKGTATISVKIGSVTRTFPVTVK